MRSKMNYVFAVVCALFALLRVKMGFDAPEFEPMNIVVILFCLGGAWFFFKEAERLRN